MRLERVHERTPALEAEVMRVMQDCGDYYGLVHGRAAGADDLDEFFSADVPGIAPGDIRAYTIRDSDAVVGCAGLVLGWKRAGQSMIGLLLVGGPHRRQGTGREAATALEDVARASPHGRSMRIGIVETNVPAFGFWRALGYRETGELRSLDGVAAPIVILEKDLHGA